MLLTSIFSDVCENAASFCCPCQPVSILFCWHDADLSTFSLWKPPGDFLYSCLLWYLFSSAVLLVPIIQGKPMRISGKWSRHHKWCNFVVHEFKSKHHKGSTETCHQQDKGSCSIVNSTMVWLQGCFHLLVIFGWEIQVLPLHNQPRLHHSQQSGKFGTKHWQWKRSCRAKGFKKPILYNILSFVVCHKVTSHWTSSCKSLENPCELPLFLSSQKSCLVP